MRDHGTHACFVHGPNPGSIKGGCRCDPCRQANAAYERERARRTAPPYVAAHRARDHVTNLAAQGVGLKTVARLSGVSHGALTKLVYGTPNLNRPPSKRIRPETEKAILGVTAAHADGRHRTHTADDYSVLLDTLVGRGWTTTAIANAIGVAHSNLRPRPGQAKVTAAKVAATRALLDRTPVTRRDRWGNSADPSWTPEDDRRDKARKATNAAERAEYRAAARPTVDDLPAIDLSALAAQEWRTRSACRLLPDDQTFIFWPGRGDQSTLDAARTVCLSCPVAQDCLDWALANGEHGVWGGTSDNQRKEMRNGRRPAIAPQPPTVEVKACARCNTPLRPAANQAKFCSRSCAMLHRHQTTAA